MDISKLTPPQSLSIKQARDWMRELNSRSFIWGKDIDGAPSAPALLSFLPSAIKKNVDDATLPSLAKEFSQWLVQNEFVQKNASDDGNWSLSLKGIGLCNASTTPRKNKNKSWDDVASLLARAAWNNVCDPDHAPLQVNDIILFGSMTSPQQTDHGDADIVCLISPKGETTQEKEVIAQKSNELGKKISLHPSQFTSNTNWDSELNQFLKGGNGFLSPTPAHQFDAFEKMQCYATGFSLFGKGVYALGDQEHCTTRNALAKGSPQAPVLLSQLKEALARLKVPNLLEVLQGRAPTDEELSALASVAITPLLKRGLSSLGQDASEMSDAAYRDKWIHKRDNQEFLSHLPTTVYRALWWAGGHPTGLAAALLTCHTQGLASVAFGVASRQLRNEGVPELAQVFETFHDQFKDIVAKDNSDVAARLDQEFKGELEHRPDLASTKSRHIPMSVCLSMVQGNWHDVRQWQDKGGQLNCLINDQPMDQPWTMLLNNLDRYKDHPENQQKSLFNFVGSGYSLDGLNHQGQNINDAAASLPLSAQELIATQLASPSIALSSNKVTARRSRPKSKQRSTNSSNL